MSFKLNTSLACLAWALFAASGALAGTGPKSSLPGALYEIDPALPASTQPPGEAPGIQVDEEGGILAMRLAGSHELLHRGYGKSFLVANGLDGRPIIVNPRGAAPGGWDSLVFDPAAADPIVAREAQPFSVTAVVRRRAVASCDVMKLYAVDGTHLHFSPTAEGTILIGQNNGRGTATEDAPGPLNQWEILYYIYDGHYASLLRNGSLTVRTPLFRAGGFGQNGASVMELLNGCGMDVAWLAIADQAPSISQLNAESDRLRVLYPSIPPQQTITEGNSWSTSLARWVRDPSATFAIVPNNPAREALPVVPSAAPGNGLALEPGARNAFSLILGSAQAGANVTTGQAVRDRFFFNYMEGDLNRALGSPMDTGQADNKTFAAVARHFRPGSPYDLHVMAPDGLHLKAMCSQGGKDCRPGHVWGGMIRLPFEWRPGMTLKVRYRSPKGPHSWAPIWMFSGQQASPGPGGNPYEGFGGPNALYRASKAAFEIDWNDNYPRTKAGVAPGYQIDFGTPDIYGVKWKTPPHNVYWANGDGWKYYGQSYQPEFERTPFDWSAGFHDLVGNWRGDGSNLIDVFVDGKLAATRYMEYAPETYADPVDGTAKTVAMHLIIGNQAIPSFSEHPGDAADNDGIPEGWTITVQEISGWYGNIADPDQHRASAANGAPAR